MPLVIRRLLSVGSCLLLWGSMTHAQAALTLSHTRIVQDSAKRSTSVIIANPSKSPYAAQVWVNTESDTAVEAVPLIASPALFRIEPDAQQTVQINLVPNDLPNDRESLFYFNVQELPQTPKAGPTNTLTIALRTRIKLFYRPSELKGRPEDRLKDLTWRIERDAKGSSLVLHNPTPYHYTFNRLELVSPGQAHKLPSSRMSAPFSEQRYTLKQGVNADSLEIKFSTITDFGGISKLQTSPVGR